MFEIFGIPSQALFGQLLLGLINGSFYALLSLGLAVIFGMLNIINFTHGAQYMMGAFLAYLLLQYLGIGYWAALVIVPILVGVTGIVIERFLLRRLQGLDHLYGLLLTFGLALIIEGVFRNYYGANGQAYGMPDALTGGHNLGFMFLPNYRAWVIAFSLIVCFGTWFAIEQTRLGSYLRAATENPTLVRAFGINVPRMVTLTYGFGVGLAGTRRGDGGADLQRIAADGLRHHHRGVRRRGDRGHGFDHGGDPHRICARHRRRSHQGIFSRGVEHGDLCHHDCRIARAADRIVRTGHLMATLAGVPTVNRQREGARGEAVAAVILIAFLAVAPFVLYPVFVMKALCFALFACAFNLLIGYVGLLSFGHALYFGWASYLAAYAAQSWAMPPGIAIMSARRRPQCSA